MEATELVSTVPQVAFKKRGAKSKSTIRKREATPPAEDSDSGFTSSEDEEGRQIKRRRIKGGVVISSASTQIPRRIEDPQSNTAAAIPTNKDNATKASNWYDEDDTVTEKKSQNKKKIDAPPDGTYKGVANYQNFIQTNPDQLSKQVGPVKSATNVRTITVTDFAPDVCKDYKQTGFCGFGDNCKYLHAREDYKQGWELDRDWEINTKGKKLSGKTVASANRNGQANQEDEDDEKLLASIPFACIICKRSYKNPVVTKCGHYFCESCALQRYRKDPSCAACGTGTGGVFNVAKRLNKLLERKRERAKQRKEKALENGEEWKDDEEP